MNVRQLAEECCPGWSQEKVIGVMKAVGISPHEDIAPQDVNFLRLVYEEIQCGVPLPKSLWRIALTVPMVIVLVGMGFGIHLALNGLPSNVGCESKSWCWRLRKTPKAVIPAKRIEELHGK